ncbi:hypothetical protein AQI70_34005 [Streptomyces curacoi]|uniref:Uncharacterized protein n=1 Tax=Streptomyces curacoi TaxID=146536 RepID=A0A124GUW1_9ACTN|nr:hypothetical protein AQI70_34005 [Streptomyces curacoi]
MVDHGSGAGAAGSDPDTHRADIGDDLGDSQEVRLVPEPADDAQLVLQLLGGARVGVQAAGDHAGLAPLPQQPHPVPGLAACAHHLRFLPFGSPD